MLNSTYLNDTPRWAVVLNGRFQTFDSESQAVSFYSRLFSENPMMSDEWPLHCEMIPPGKQSLYPAESEGSLLKMSELSEFDLLSQLEFCERHTRTCEGIDMFIGNPGTVYSKIYLVGLGVLAIVCITLSLISL
jgi:hypothetical protein